MTGVAERIDRRIEVLTRYIDDGPDSLIDAAGRPIVFTPPTSLNKARLWDDPRLGIEKIGDPASFTREHARHGSKVKEVDLLLRRLPKAAKRRPPKSLTAENAELRRELANARDLIVKLTGQVAVKGEELRVERARRIDTERVLSQARARERKERERRGVAALVLVGVDAADEDGE